VDLLLSLRGALCGAVITAALPDNLIMTKSRQSSHESTFAVRLLSDSSVDRRRCGKALASPVLHHAKRLAPWVLRQGLSAQCAYTYRATVAGSRPLRTTAFYAESGPDERKFADVVVAMKWYFQRRQLNARDACVG
jgi:hypothetical protein